METSLRKIILLLPVFLMFTPVLAYWNMGSEITVDELQTNWTAYENSSVRFNGTFLFSIDSNYAYVEGDGYVVEVFSADDFDMAVFSRGDRLNITGYAWISCHQYDKGKRRVSVGNYSACPELYNGSDYDNITTISTGYPITEPELVTDMSTYDETDYGKYIKSEQIVFKDFGTITSSFWYANWYDLQNSDTEFNTFDSNRLDNSTLAKFDIINLTGFPDNYYSSYITMDSWTETGTTLDDDTCQSFETSLDTKDCAVELSNLGEMENTSLDKHWISINGTNVRNRWSAILGLVLCTVYPPSCTTGNQPHLFLADETSNLSAVWYYPYGDSNTMLDAIYNGTNMMPYVDAQGYFNVVCKNSVSLSGSDIKYADCTGDETNYITKISDEPPTEKEPVVTTLETTIPTANSEFLALYRYTANFDSSYVACRIGINETHYRRIQKDGTDVDEIRGWDYFGFDNYTTMNQSMLGKLHYCAFNSGTNDELTIYSNSTLIEPYINYWTNLSGNLDVICRGYLWNDYPDRSVIQCRDTDLFDLNEQRDYFETAIIGDGLCSSLETFGYNAINFDSACSSSLGVGSIIDGIGNLFSGFNQSMSLAGNAIASANVQYSADLGQLITAMLLIGAISVGLVAIGVLTWQGAIGGLK